MTAARFPVEAGHVMMFARAIGDDNPVYRDPEYAAASEAGGVIAPPTFSQASAQFDPDYPLRPNGQPGSAPAIERPRPRTSAAPGGQAAGARVCTPSSTSRTTGPCGPATCSTATPAGTTWEKQGRRAGKLVFRETITEYRDARRRAGGHRPLASACAPTAR